MFCPRCGSSQSEELKFCKVCGANLYAVRQAVDARETEGKFNWSTWITDLKLSGEEAQRRKAALEHHAGLTPAVKRYNEIKSGVITGSVGIALMAFLHVFMQGIVLGGKIPADTAEILSRVWFVGIIPIFVGLALIVNGLFVSKKIVELTQHPGSNELNPLGQEQEPRALRAADTSEFTPSRFSVTEQTTKHLRSPDSH
ncbi:MAG TPA: hypothetical protein VGO56_21355 [Pyrinomonadaceae bacterium]|jgi:hypothetical protein|nr:hypothetical protein [Pyrinomonadaceae bacterium]